MTEATEEKTSDGEKEPVFQPVKTPHELASLLFNIMCAVRGVDPNQVQGLAKFMNPDNIDETTYYPTQRTSLAIAQLRMFGEAFYKGEEWNEYELAADLLGMGFKGLKGFKSTQYVDITSGQANLDKLQGVPEEVKKTVLSGIFSRGSE